MDPTLWELRRTRSALTAAFRGRDSLWDQLCANVAGKIRSHAILRGE